MSSLGAAIESPSSWPPSGAVRSTRGGFWRKRLTSRPSWTLTGPTSPWSGSSSDPRSRSPSSSAASRKIKPEVNYLIFSLFFSQQKPTVVSCGFFVHNRGLAIVTIEVINDRPHKLILKILYPFSVLWWATSDQSPGSTSKKVMSISGCQRRTRSKWVATNYFYYLDKPVRSKQVG